MSVDLSWTISVYITTRANGDQNSMKIKSLVARAELCVFRFALVFFEISPFAVNK